MSLVQYPKILLFGDSITQFSFRPGGFGALLCEYFERRCDFLNRGFSGYNTRWGRVALPRILDDELAKQLSYFVLFLGANDSALPIKNTFQCVPLEEYETNIREMVQFLMNKGISKEKIVIISPPPVEEKAWEHSCNTSDPPREGDRDNEYTKKYSDTCEKISQDLGTKNINLWKIFTQRKDWKELFVDGLHLNEAGNQVVYKQLKKIFDQTNFPFILPGYREATVENIQTWSP